MKEQKTESFDKWTGRFEPIPAKQFDLFSFIDGYEREAYKVLKAKGYPTDIHGILARHDTDKQIKDITNMLIHFRAVRIYTQLKDAENAALYMALGVRCAMLARVRPVELSMDIGEARRQQQRTNRAKKKTHKGLTKTEIEFRNEKIISAWKKSKLTEHSFAERQAKIHNISVTQIKNILKKNK